MNPRTGKVGHAGFTCPISGSHGPPSTGFSLSLYLPTFKGQLVPSPASPCPLRSRCMGVINARTEGRFISLRISLMSCWRTASWATSNAPIAAHKFRRVRRCNEYHYDTATELGLMQFLWGAFAPQVDSGAARMAEQAAFLTH
jgi:hypothetical protein